MLVLVLVTGRVWSVRGTHCGDAHTAAMLVETVADYYRVRIDIVYGWSAFFFCCCDVCFCFNIYFSASAWPFL